MFARRWFVDVVVFFVFNSLPYRDSGPSLCYYVMTVKIWTFKKKIRENLRFLDLIEV